MEISHSRVTYEIEFWKIESSHLIGSTEFTLVCDRGLRNSKVATLMGLQNLSWPVAET